MADNKKKRMSMLDGLAAAGTRAPAGSMMSNNRALRSARDAVDSHHVWELDPAQVEDDRYSDRLDPGDVQDLRASIEQNGQTVPILVRRHPSDSSRYLLVYGRRRLEAIRGSDRVTRVRALIANLDDTAALRAQVSENTGRRDLSYIERALFARELLDNGFGTQAQIAEVLNATRSAVSMALSVANAIGPFLARAIGPAHGIGRPRWEAVAREVTDARCDIAQLVEVAQTAHAKAAAQFDPEADDAPGPDPSVVAFDAVARHLRKHTASAPVTGQRKRASALVIDGQPAGTVAKSTGGVRLDLKGIDDGFAKWLEAHAQDVVQELHARWKRDA